MNLEHRNEIVTDDILSYKKTDKSKGKAVKILRSKKISEGCFGDIFRVKSEISAEKSQKVKKRSFVVKSFDSLMDAKNALEKLILLREAGLKTYPTYRLDDDKKSILMTNLSKKGQRVISTNTDSKDSQLIYRHQISEIENFDDLLKKMLEHAEMASKKKIFLPNDSYFFSLYKTTNPSAKKMDFFIGDPDSVISKKEWDSEEEILDLNKYSLYSALSTMINTVILPPHCLDYLEKVRLFFNR
ncbi:MAG: hypothetical protein M1127_02925 [Patescibacteria group bacterium]|nr:hypothetical protein [Patescibacteria group bacterium]